MKPDGSQWYQALCLRTKARAVADEDAQAIPQLKHVGDGFAQRTPGPHGYIRAQRQQFVTKAFSLRFALCFAQGGARPTLPAFDEVPFRACKARA